MEEVRKFKDLECDDVFGSSISSSGNKSSRFLDLFWYCMTMLH